MKYLALGDSYTIGEGISLKENFPYQIVMKLREQDYSIYNPHIIAKTWRTSTELLKEITYQKYTLSDKYDIVTLLIGVNNQYRWYDIQVFESDFKKLIEYSLTKSSSIVVLNIPNRWITPFNTERDISTVTDEILTYNNFISSICTHYHIELIDVYRLCQGVNKDKDLCTDGLHYSSSMYARWADKCIEYILAHTSVRPWNIKK